MHAKTTLIFVAALFFYSCEQPSTPKQLGTASLDLPKDPYDYGTFNNYVPTLGRVLFYDTRLSASNSVACASCHKQALAFADNAQFSLGFAGQLTGRNSMPIQNLSQGGFFNPGGDSGVVASPPTLFWDGREELVAAQVLRPITNHIEMGMTLDGLTTKLATLTEYKALFNDAFGTEEITQGRIAVSLAGFISSINSNNSKFDQFMHGQPTLSAAELHGRELFFGKYNCNTCHQVTIPNGYQLGGGGGFVDTGLDQSPTDKGRFDVTGNPSDIGKFKIPTLRNVALTAPYMHDGRFTTLEEVLNHYSTGILSSKNLDPRLRENGVPKQLLITDEDKQALIAFMNTLTDYHMITDQKLSSPFKTN